MKKNDQDIISVLIPLYNVEKYIARCLDSILNQTYQNFEIIVVNDGSLDKSIDIAKSYAKQDKRLKIIENGNNMGLAWTRMVGYSNASGNYIVFCDSDDYMPVHALETLYNAIKDTKADIVVGNYWLAYSNEQYGNVSNNQLLYGGDQRAVYLSLLKKEMSHSLWGKIYKKELFEQKQYLTHKDFINAEDAYLFYQIVKNTSKIEVISEVVYNYFQNIESSTKVQLSEKALSSIIAFWNFRDKMFIEDEELYKLTIKRSIDTYCNLLQNGHKIFVLNSFIDIPNFNKYISINSLIKLYPIREAVIKLLIIKLSMINKSQFWLTVNKCFRLLKNNKKK
ncbi:glycosyltransferase family 2 protein [Massilibacteroides vaginae]|uniref:glycosyltransferase family 2 protein n=1 Tax=Massilibacteroides vaginae TaxID=1673718 RepID=UPI000A1CBEE1|nr:glycosyltransferase family 2 protein [Massilibacteroides vaginae]